MKRARLPPPKTVRTIAVLFLALMVDACKSSGGGSGGAGQDQGAPPQISRGPQLAQVSETSILIAWLSSKPALGSVEYGLDPSLGLASSEGAPTGEHVLRLEGLLPGTRYHYRVLLDGAVESDGHTFDTAPADPSVPFRFAVFGDSGSGSRNQYDVAARVLEAGPVLVLIAGDVVYDAGRASEVDPHYFVPYANLVDRIPFYPALGNHDVSTQNGKPLLDALYLPVNDQDGSERYFSFDHANAHFVALDSTSNLLPGSPQRAWLDADLGRSAATWQFVYFHHPPYSSSQHGSSFAIRQSLGPIFDQHRVDVVFSGHDHDYERTYPLAREQVFGGENDPHYTDPEGTIYIVTGGGGRSLYSKGRSYFTAYSESAYHFTRVDVEGSTLAVRAIRRDGTVMDDVTVTKTLAP